MKLEDQVCSLELAKKLKELGVKQESLHYWRFAYSTRMSNGELDYRNDAIVDAWHYRGTSPQTGFASAFTVAELGEMLPHHTKMPTCYWNEEAPWWCMDEQAHNPCEGHDNEANARAKMLIHLIEQGIMEPNK